MLVYFYFIILSRDGGLGCRTGLGGWAARLGWVAVLGSGLGGGGAGHEGGLGMRPGLGGLGLGAGMG